MGRSALSPETRLLLGMIHASPTTLADLMENTGLEEKQVRNRLDPFVARGEIICKRRRGGVKPIYLVPEHRRELVADKANEIDIAVPIRPRPVKTRRCLCCQREFRSEGAHNRLCEPCRRKAADISPYSPDPH